MIFLGMIGLILNFMTKSKSLYSQINSKFLSKMKASKVIDENGLSQLEEIINSPKLKEKKLEALLIIEDETKKTGTN